jgi:hypothetical protein
MVAHAMVNNENYFMNMHVELSTNVNYFHVLNLCYMMDYLA